MKTILRVFIVVFVFSFISCDKDVLDLPTMSAKIDGVDWTAVVRVTVLKDSTFSITGTSVDGNIISLIVYGKEEGTYQLSTIPLNTEFGGTYMDEASVDGAYISTSGEVIISKLDVANTSISGEFHFMATTTNLTTTISITEGKFDGLKYTEE